MIAQICLELQKSTRQTYPVCYFKQQVPRKARKCNFKSKHKCSFIAPTSQHLLLKFIILTQQELWCLQSIIWLEEKKWLLITPSAPYHTDKEKLWGAFVNPKHLLPFPLSEGMGCWSSWRLKAVTRWQKQQLFGKCNWC